MEKHELADELKKMAEAFGAVEPAPAYDGQCDARGRPVVRALERVAAEKGYEVRFGGTHYWVRDAWGMCKNVEAQVHVYRPAFEGNGVIETLAHEIAHIGLRARGWCKGQEELRALVVGFLVARHFGEYSECLTSDLGVQNVENWSSRLLDSQVEDAYASAGEFAEALISKVTCYMENDDGSH